MTFKYYSSDLDKCALNLPLLLLSSTSVQSNFFRFLSTDCTPCGHMLRFWLIAVWESPCCCKNLLVCSCKLWKTLKDLQKTWKSVAQDHFLNITRKPGSLEAKYDEMKGGTRLLDYLDFFVRWFVFMDTHIIIWWQLVKPWLKFIKAVCEIVPMFIHLCSQRGTVVLPVNSPQKRTSRMWWWRLLRQPQFKSLGTNVCTLSLVLFLHVPFWFAVCVQLPFVQVWVPQLLG